MPDDQPGPRVGFWNSVRRKWIGTPNNDPALSLTEIFASGMSMDEIRAAWKSRLAAATLGRSRSEKKAAAARINGKKGGRPLPEGARIARVFEDVGGYYVCDEDGPMYTGGRAHGTKAAGREKAACEEVMRLKSQGRIIPRPLKKTKTLCSSI
jgi:hypothetical protein